MALSGELHLCRAEDGSMVFSRYSSTPEDAAWHGRPQMVGRLGQGQPARASRARQRKYDMRARIRNHERLTPDCASECLRQFANDDASDPQDRESDKSHGCRHVVHVLSTWALHGLVRCWNGMTTLEALGREAGGLNISRGRDLHPSEVGQEGPRPFEPAEHLDVRFRAEVRQIWRWSASGFRV